MCRSREKSWEGENEWYSLQVEGKAGAPLRKLLEQQCYNKRPTEALFACRTIIIQLYLLLLSRFCSLWLISFWGTVFCSRNRPPSTVARSWIVFTYLCCCSFVCIVSTQDSSQHSWPACWYSYLLLLVSFSPAKSLLGNDSTSMLPRNRTQAKNHSWPKQASGRQHCHWESCLIASAKISHALLLPLTFRRLPLLKSGISPWHCNFSDCSIILLFPKSQKPQKQLSLIALRFQTASRRKMVREKIAN